MMNISFKKWLESFIYQSMVDPHQEGPPSGAEITADPYVRASDFPPTKKNKPRRSRLANPKKVNKTY
jgi:hypothetical protein